MYLATYYLRIEFQLNICINSFQMANYMIFNMAAMAAIFKFGFQRLEQIKMSSWVGRSLPSFSFIASVVSEKKIFKGFNVFQRGRTQSKVKSRSKFETRKNPYYM